MQPPELVFRSVRKRCGHTHGAPVFDDDAFRGGIQTNVDTGAATVAGQVVGERPRVGHDVVHARDPVGGLLLGADEDHAQAHQPVEHLRGVVSQHAAQPQVVAWCERAGMFAEVFEMGVGAVGDPGTALVRGARGGN